MFVSVSSSHNLSHVIRVVTLLLPVAFFSAYPNPNGVAAAGPPRTASPNVLAATHVSHSVRAAMPIPLALHYIPIPEAPTHHKRVGYRTHKQRSPASAVDKGVVLESSDGVRERNPEKADEDYLRESAGTVAVSDKTRVAVETFSHGYAVMLMIM
jgi:hypothetical protein